MNKRNWIAILLALCLILAGCGQAGSTEVMNTENSGKSQSQEQNTNESESTIPDEITTTEQEVTTQEDTVSKVDGYPAFDFDKKTVTLNSGHEIPILGLGMFSLSDSEAENSTYWALKDRRI